MLQYQAREHLIFLADELYQSSGDLRPDEVEGWNRYVALVAEMQELLKDANVTASRRDRENVRALRPAI